MTITASLDNKDIQAEAIWPPKGLSTDENGWENGKLTIQGKDYKVKRTPTYVCPTKYKHNDTMFGSLKEIVIHIIKNK